MPVTAATYSGRLKRRLDSVVHAGNQRRDRLLAVPEHDPVSLDRVLAREHPQRGAEAGRLPGAGLEKQRAVPLLFHILQTVNANFAIIERL